MRKELTRGEIEAEITRAIEKFEREYMGRGPEESRTFLLGETILVRLRGVLTPAERQLASSEDSKVRSLIKRLRQELIEKGRPLLEAIVKDITGIPVISLHTDISTKTGERIIVFSLKEPLL